MAIVSVTYYFVTNYPKVQWLKTTHIISQLKKKKNHYFPKADSRKNNELSKITKSNLYQTLQEMNYPPKEKKQNRFEH